MLGLKVSLDFAKLSNKDTMLQNTCKQVGTGLQSSALQNAFSATTYNARGNKIEVLLRSVFVENFGYGEMARKIFRSSDARRRPAALL